jgi:hypothetical protein
MKPDILFHVPGTKGLFDYDEIVARTKLPKKDPDYIPLPKVVIPAYAKSGHLLGEIPFSVVPFKY